MLSSSMPRFPHRLNRVGFHESICSNCHLTVGSAWDEADLEKFELIHACDPIRLYQLTEDRGRAERPSLAR
jgi:hypothetical protein